MRDIAVESFKGTLALAFTMAAISWPSSGIAKCLMGAPTPGFACPDEATDGWWFGSWATREVDGEGRPLTGFTLLRPDGRYKTTIVYDDGRKIEVSGHYDIRFANDYTKVVVQQVAPPQTEESQNIQQGIKIAGNYDQPIYNLYSSHQTLMGAPLPRSTMMECVKGTITYYVEEFFPHDFNFDPVQSFRFVTQGLGFVRVWGPGSAGSLARQYSREILE